MIEGQDQKIIEVKQSVFEDNNQDANRLREQLKKDLALKQEHKKCYKEEIEKAIENWITAFSYRPDDESVCLNLATTYFSKEMKFQSIFFYEKYLKYAKDKTSAYYLEIKKSIDEFKKLSLEFYQKAQRALSEQDIDTAIQALIYGLKNYPLNFDINLLLGKLYYEKQEKYVL